MDSKQVARIFQLLVVHFQRTDLPVVVSCLLIVELLLVFDRIVVLHEQPFRFIMDEVAEDLEAVPLLYWFLFE